MVSSARTSQTGDVATRRALVSIGGVCAVAGSVLYLVAGAVHQDLPSGAANAVPHVAGHGSWHLIHLVAVLGIALWPVGFAALAATLADGMSRALGRVATGAMLVGFLVFVVDTLLDGFVLKVAADAWAGSSGEAKEQRYLIAEAVYRILQGTFVAYIIWLIGVPFLIMGVAVAVGRAYARWLGWAAAVVGGFATVAGSSYYLGLDAIPDLVGFVVPSGLLTLWLIVMGILMLRGRARSTSA